MRTGALIFAFVLIVACYAGIRLQLNARTADLPPVTTSECSPGARAPCPHAASRINHVDKTNLAPASSKVDFATQIRPILEAKCQPCHFSGGTMYQRLPFDRPETIKTLGTRLFTRIKDENDRRLIRDFLSQD